MILTHLLPKNHQCPLCGLSFTDISSCEYCHYYVLKKDIMIEVNSYRIFISKRNDQLLIMSLDNYKMHLCNQVDFVDFNFAAKDIESRIETFLFYQ
jgi:hypothetical protein